MNLINKEKNSVLTTSFTDRQTGVCVRVCVRYVYVCVCARACVCVHGHVSVCVCWGVGALPIIDFPVKHNVLEDSPASTFRWAKQA